MHAHRIDVHHHILPPNYVRLVGDERIGPLLVAGKTPATLDFPFDTTKAITSMLFAGTFARCRDASFIFSHAGGTVPFLAERIARLQVRPEFKAGVPDGVMFELKRLFFDTALSANE